ncbi:MAG: ornithine carbamoyltransferase [Nocardioidaceae bacterium]|nr:ornithine carbamoyltransferase [Nocardioidaceae bacterium]
MRHFLRDDDVSPQEQAELLALAAAMKAAPYDAKPLAGPHTVAMIFDKPTLRSQTSFAAGTAELGGNPLVVDGGLAGIGRRESVADVARVLGGQASMIVWRTFAQAAVEEMAAMSGVPVINALTDEFHPCQLLADLLTIQEHKGELAGLTVAFLGDAACNMGNSWALAGTMAAMHVVFGCPEGYAPDAGVLVQAEAMPGGSVHVTDDPVAAVAGADVVVTDTWVSMGKEDEAADRRVLFSPYAVTSELMAHAKPDAIALHCLPAYRENEISAEVIDGPQSVVWDEAENRRHVQKAVMAWLYERRGVEPDE